MLKLFRRNLPDFPGLKAQFQQSLQNALVNALVAACTVLEKHFGFTKEQVQKFAELWQEELNWIAKTSQKR